MVGRGGKGKVDKDWKKNQPECSDFFFSEIKSLCLEQQKKEQLNHVPVIVNPAFQHLFFKNSPDFQ